VFARIAVALVLVPTVVALVWFCPPWFLTPIAALVAILALIEFVRLGDLVGLRGFRNWTIFCAALIFVSQLIAGLSPRAAYGLTFPSGGGFHRGISFSAIFSIETSLFIFLLGVMTIIMLMKRPLHEALPAISVSSAGLLFVALPFSYLVRLDEIEPQGKQLVLFTLCLVWAGDIVAYFVGKGIGRVKMAPALSPKKTWEGAAGNVVASLLIGYGFAKWMQADVLTMLLIAAAANIAGQAGDLLESSYKRGASVKDSSGLLPGHGGMLDRVDSLILAAPVVWFLFEWFGSRLITQ
jgi:phosphatidate cytidylyltransferase